LIALFLVDGGRLRDAQGLELPLFDETVNFVVGIVDEPLAAGSN